MDKQQRYNQAYIANSNVVTRHRQQCYTKAQTNSSVITKHKQTAMLLKAESHVDKQQCYNKE